MSEEPFALHLPQSQTQFIEPVWRLLLGNKALLCLMWVLFPDHPALWPCTLRAPPVGDYVRKPQQGWEGESVSLFSNQMVTESTEGDFAGEACVYQAMVHSPRYDNRIAQLGVWMVVGDAAALGIRESEHTNNSPFTPHIISDH
jgi:glutathionylspermidine synthase